MKFEGFWDCLGLRQKPHFLQRANFMEHGSISFPDWKQALVRASLEASRQGAFERGIISFLRHGKASHALVTGEPGPGVRSPLDQPVPGNV